MPTTRVIGYPSREGLRTLPPATIFDFLIFLPLARGGYLLFLFLMSEQKVQIKTFIERHPSFPTICLTEQFESVNLNQVTDALSSSNIELMF